VCGKAAQSGQTQLVPDVEAFPGHIACDSESQSEIVVPIIQNGRVRSVLLLSWKALADRAGLQVVAIIDIDCASKDGFHEEDQSSLEEFAKLLADACNFQV